MKNVTTQEKIAFIREFDTHYLMNSWNGVNGFAIRCKYHDLGLTSAEQDRFFEIISAEGLADDYYFSINEEIKNWQEETKEKYGYSVKTENVRCRLPSNDPRCAKGQTHEFKDKKITHYRQNPQFCGRSGGWLVLGEYNGHNCFASNAPRDFDYENEEEVNYYYDLLNDFQSLFENLKAITKEFCQREITEETYIVEKTRKIFGD